jgi:hypothetical protein
MQRIRSVALAAGCVACCAALSAPARAAGPAAAAPAIMTSGKTLGQVSIVPPPRLVNGELILKVVALNESQRPATFGPQDIEVLTADGKAVPLMSLGALIARVKAQAGSGRGGADAYNSSYTAGPATSYNQYGQPDVSHFTGNSAPLGGGLSPQAPVAAAGAGGGNAALAQQIAGLKAGILQDLTIAPGEVKGGEVVTQRIRFHWREKHTLRIEVRFNGEQHEFTLPAPAAE